jgi:hypothetical protein
MLVLKIVVTYKYPLIESANNPIGKEIIEKPGYTPIPCESNNSIMNISSG